MIGMIKRFVLSIQNGKEIIKEADYTYLQAKLLAQQARAVLTPSDADWFLKCKREAEGVICNEINADEVD